MLQGKEGLGQSWGQEKTFPMMLWVGGGGLLTICLGEAAPLIMQSRFLPSFMAAGVQKARGQE